MEKKAVQMRQLYVQGSTTPMLRLKGFKIGDPYPTPAVNQSYRRLSSVSGSTLEVCPDESSAVVVKPVTEMYTDNFLHLLGEAGGVCLQGIIEASPELGSTEKGNEKASFSLMDKGGYHLRVLAIGTNAAAVSELTAGSRIFVHGGELVQELA